MRSAIILLAVLIGYWLTLSGYFDKPLVLTMGAISVCFVVWLTARMKILDAETVPYFHGKAIGYFVWLFKEIAKANMAVVRAVLSPDMEISPKQVIVNMNHDTDLGLTTFANSITLTPGTISIDMKEEGMLVHALLSEMADPAGFVEMGERAGWSVSDPMTGVNAGEGRKS